MKSYEYQVMVETAETLRLASRALLNPEKYEVTERRNK